MKPFFTIALILLISIFGHSQNISTRVSNKQIILEFDLDRYDCNTSEITVQWSSDGGKNYEKLCCVTGAVGKNVSNGLNKTIKWNVLEYTDGEPFIDDNVIFWIHQKTCISKSPAGSGWTSETSFSDDMYSIPKSYNISNNSSNELNKQNTNGFFQPTE